MEAMKIKDKLPNVFFHYVLKKLSENFILILSSQLHLGTPNDLSSRGFPQKFCIKF